MVVTLRIKMLKLTILILNIAFANTYTFKYSNKSIEVNAPTKEQAFKQATKICFNDLTNGVYQGEEKGLEIIDTCVNMK